MARQATRERSTNETQVRVQLALDGTGQVDIATGVGFLDHMLHHVAKHGLLDLTVNAKGDRHIDDHHTAEDVFITLGDALGEALGAKAGIARYGHAVVPMDEALAEVVIDLSGRSAFVFNVSFPAEKIGSFDTELVREGLQALSNHARMNLHVHARYGQNSHHIAEAIFKALGRALRAAVSPDPRQPGVPSTKGAL